MRWAVAFHDEFVPEFHGLHEQVQDEIYAIARMLEQFGPQLGRPRVDTLNGSRHANMKEMRFSAAGHPRMHGRPLQCIANRHILMVIS